MKLNQNGSANGLTVGLAICVVLLIASLVFGIWSFSGRLKYKNNADQLISAAVTTAKGQQQKSDNQAFAVSYQNPLTQYVGPPAYGTITLLYPKTWSSYVNSTGSGGSPIDGYFYPGTLPAVTDEGTINFALRLKVDSQSYTTAVNYFNGQVQDNKASVKAYSLPKVPSVVGVEVVGQLSNGVNGTEVILPLRNQALEVWTEGTAYLSQFNSDILPNLSFSP